MFDYVFLRSYLFIFLACNISATNFTMAFYLMCVKGENIVIGEEEIHNLRIVNFVTLYKLTRVDIFFSFFIIILHGGKVRKFDNWLATHV